MNTVERTLNRYECEELARRLDNNFFSGLSDAKVRATAKSFLIEPLLGMGYIETLTLNHLAHTEKVPTVLAEMGEGKNKTGIIVTIVFLFVMWGAYSSILYGLSTWNPDMGSMFAPLALCVKWLLFASVAFALPVGTIATLICLGQILSFRNSENSKEKRAIYEMFANDEFIQKLTNIKTGCTHGFDQILSTTSAKAKQWLEAHPLPPVVVLDRPKG